MILSSIIPGIFHMQYIRDYILIDLHIEILIATCFVRESLHIQIARRTLSVNESRRLLN
jgi:hypothetical protein